MSTLPSLTVGEPSSMSVVLDHELPFQAAALVLPTPTQNDAEGHETEVRSTP